MSTSVVAFLSRQRDKNHARARNGRTRAKNQQGLLLEVYMYMPFHLAIVLARRDPLMTSMPLR